MDNIGPMLQGQLFSLRECSILDYTSVNCFRKSRFIAWEARNIGR